MNPDPTTAISLDYLVEFNDDANRPERPDPEVIIIPPTKDLQELEKKLKEASETFRQRPDTVTATLVLRLLNRGPSDETWRRQQLGDISQEKLRSYAQSMFPAGPAAHGPV
jgi:hypothetical protein